MEMLAIMIQWMLTQFSLFMLLLSIAFILLNWVRRKTIDHEVMYQLIALLPLGVTSIYAFIMHAFFPVIAAQAIGWQNSPFQFEVAIANLAIGVIAILSVYQSYGFRLATVIASACWLWGDAIGHLYQILIYQNYTTGNAGSWFYTDMLVPLMLCFYILKKHNDASSKH